MKRTCFSACPSISAIEELVNRMIITPATSPGGPQLVAVPDFSISGSMCPEITVLDERVIPLCVV